MNEKSTLQDLLNQLSNSNYWVKKIAAAYLGVKPEEVCITVTKEEAIT